MPDIQNFTVTPLASASVTVPRFTISAQIVESRAGGAVLFDFTGANAISFPAILQSLTAQERIDLLGKFVEFLILHHAGLA